MLPTAAGLILSQPSKMIELDDLLPSEYLTEDELKELQSQSDYDDLEASIPTVQERNQLLR